MNDLLKIVDNSIARVESVVSELRAVRQFVEKQAAGTPARKRQNKKNGRVSKYKGKL